MQAYALGEALRKLGYDARLLQRLPPPSLKTKIKTFLRDFGLPGMSFPMTSFDRFKTRHIPTLKPYCERQLREEADKADVLISGSDQIWNTSYRFDPFMFLDFAPGKKRISYASSIGTSCIPEDYKDRVRTLLAPYSHISLREKSAALAVSSLTGRDDIACVMDPVFLLERVSWSQLAALSRGTDLSDEPYMLCYLVGKRPEYASGLLEVSKRTGLRPVIIASKENGAPQLEDARVVRYASPELFLALIERASWVVTDSFHATAFAMIFQRNFVEFSRFATDDPKSQNSRILDFLKLFSLEGRLYPDPCWSEKLDYSKLTPLMERFSSESLLWLQNAIEC